MSVDLLLFLFLCLMLPVFGKWSYTWNLKSHLLSLQMFPIFCTFYPLLSGTSIRPTQHVIMSPFPALDLFSFVLSLRHCDALWKQWQVSFLYFTLWLFQINCLTLLLSFWYLGILFCVSRSLLASSESSVLFHDVLLLSFWFLLLCI